MERWLTVSPAQPDPVLLCAGPLAVHSVPRRVTDSPEVDAIVAELERAGLVTISQTPVSPHQRSCDLSGA